MEKISEQLIQLSDKLDREGKIKCSNVIDELIKHQSLVKVAQYVGVIGYVLKQNRAMGNCIRNKRISSSGSMQEVVMGCLKEYQDGQQYDNNEWTSKYAQVIQKLPDQFASSHIDFLEALAEENQITEHIARVKKAQKVLEQENMKNDFIDHVAFNLDSLEQILKEGDADPRPFKLAAPQSPRSLWSRFWSPSWSRGGKDKDTQFEMDAVLESLMNIQGDIQQIRGGISQLRYQSRGVQDQTVQKHLQSLSDNNWEQTTNGMYALNQALGAWQQSDPDNTSALGLVQTSSQIEENIEQVFDEIKSVQQNMYNLRLRDPVKGSGSLASASEEYGDLARTLDRLYINPLDERALHYSLRLHGRLEDTLNERAGAQDPEYSDWINDPGSELGQSRINAPADTGMEDPGGVVTQNPSAPIDSSLVDSVAKISNDPNALSTFIYLLKQMTTVAMKPETKQAVHYLLDMLKEQESNLPNEPAEQQPNVVQTGNMEETQPVEDAGTPSVLDVLRSAQDINGDWSKTVNPHLNALMNPAPTANNPAVTASSLQKLTKVADSLENWNSDLADLLREYIEEEDDALPKFPSTSSIIKEHEASNRKLTEKKAGAVALST